MEQIKRAVAGPWGSAAGLMTNENMKDIDSRFPLEDEPVKARLLLSPLFLRSAELDSLRPSLSGLKDLASQDKGEWVEMVYAAVDGYDGRIHTDRVLERLPKVESSIEEVEVLAEVIDPSVHRPLAEKYLSDDVLKQIGALQYRKNTEKLERRLSHSHFTVRKPARKCDEGKMQGRVPGVSLAPPGALPTFNGFSAGRGPASTDPKGPGNPRKRPAMPGAEASIFLKPTRPKLPGRGAGGAAMAEKKPKVLDITSVKQMQTVTEKRRAELEKEKEELREKEALERAVERQQKREDLQERKNFMRDSERRKREKMRGEKRQHLDDEILRKTKAPVEGAKVAAALEAARDKADIESSKEVRDLAAYHAEIDDDSDDV